MTIRGVPMRSPVGSARMGRGAESVTAETAVSVAYSDLAATVGSVPHSW